MKDRDSVLIVFKDEKDMFLELNEKFVFDKKDDYVGVRLRSTNEFKIIKGIYGLCFPINEDTGDKIMCYFISEKHLSDYYGEYSKLISFKEIRYENTIDNADLKCHKWLDCLDWETRYDIFNDKDNCGEILNYIGFDKDRFPKIKVTKEEYAKNTFIVSDIQNNICRTHNNYNYSFENGVIEMKPIQ